MIDQFIPHAKAVLHVGTYFPHVTAENTKPNTACEATRLQN